MIYPDSLDYTTKEAYLADFRRYRQSVRKKHPKKIGATTLTEKHIGARVAYVPQHIRFHGIVLPGNMDEVEVGRVTHWNSAGVFVCYDGDRNSKCTSPEDLTLF